MADLTLSLTKRFALFAGLVVVAASLLLISMYRQVAGDDLPAMAERSHVSLAHMFSNVVWAALAGFLTTAHLLPPTPLRRNTETHAHRRSPQSSPPAPTTP